MYLPVSRFPFYLARHFSVSSATVSILPLSLLCLSYFLPSVLRLPFLLRAQSSPIPSQFPLPLFSLINSHLTCYLRPSIYSIRRFPTGRLVFPFFSPTACRYFRSAGNVYRPSAPAKPISLYSIQLNTPGTCPFQHFSSSRADTPDFDRCFLVYDSLAHGSVVRGAHWQT